MEDKIQVSNSAQIAQNCVLADAVFRPIIFSTPMVQAILAGQKTITRIIINPQPKLGMDFTHVYFDNINTVAHFYDDFISEIQPENTIDYNLNIKCPYGNVGDILWVRESFYEPIFEGLNGKYYYKADLEPQGWCFKWKPSLFMPKPACRLFLEITDIRIERLQEITDEDCKNEGIKRTIFKPTGEECFYFYPCNDLRDDSYLDSPKTSFYSLWKSINGQKSWDENHFVWAISFKLVECPYGFR